MNANPVERVVRLVHDVSARAYLWLVDATDKQAVRCCSLSFDSEEQARSVAQEAELELEQGKATGKIIALLDAAAQPAATKGTYSTVEDILGFLAEKPDPALRNTARELLAELQLT